MYTKVSDVHMVLFSIFSLFPFYYTLENVMKTYVDVNVLDDLVVKPIVQAQCVIDFALGLAGTVLGLRGWGLLHCHIALSYVL